MTPQTQITAIAAITPAEVDRWAELSAWKAENNPKLTELEKLSAKIRKQFHDLPALGSYYVFGERSKILVGPRRNQRTVNVALAIRLWTSKRLKSLFTIGVEALEGLLGKDEAAKAITEARTGYRDLTAMPHTEAPCV